ncbi:23S rRNA (adenine(2030)-N(6))-methyltransferase RlmJ [Halomonas alkaliantarctica]|uniref:Ribosomal RNA large subunit methyltransferase J n=1 Tax=Halomonas alkaliantarctica TaxID=232346 RepID=A0ABY8LM12_9GAMM|nr:23S rRNA (adenine(2030)-N(6))-methyltransferase RlmJ [Halomonas alkaliantarctica]WGI25478.1 23S rRNA (adenine(2030)-N(6))-methyltransferase RlmJ [Halomonas alkaliantarctica]
MLSYQHAYHAGNFADVHKHLTLYAVIEHLLRKKTAITYVDTHAGRGLYPLNAQETQRLQEYREGIWPLWQAHTGLNDTLLSAWKAVLTSAQSSPASLTHYPGSPWWLSHSLREQDRLTLFELHPGEHEQLSTQGLPPHAKRVFGDGLAGLKAMLPAPSPRLCVLIDPSYERKAEYQEVADTVVYTLEKARHGVVLIWYPLLPVGHHYTLLSNLAESGIRKIWRSELLLRESGEQAHGMFGSGMLVINPPWGLDNRLAAAMAEITPLLGADSRYQSDWWVGE